MESPTTGLWTCIKRVFQFLGESSKHGYGFASQRSSLEPVAYRDADWAGSKTSRKSTSGYLSRAAGEAILTKLKMQSAFATSTAESKYFSLGMAPQESVWVGRMFAVATGTEFSPGI